MKFPFPRRQRRPQKMKPAEQCPRPEPTHPNIPEVPPPAVGPMVPRHAREPNARRQMPRGVGLGLSGSIIALAWLLGIPGAIAQPSIPPPPPATQAEVNAGVVTRKYVSPLTLAGASFVSTNLPAGVLTNGDTRAITFTESLVVGDGAVNADSHGVFASGWGGFAYADYSHVEGFRNLATGTASHAEGNSTTNSGLNSHTEGYLTRAYGDNSHAAGVAAVAGANNTYIWASTLYTNASPGSFMVYSTNGIRLLGSTISGNGSGLTNLNLGTNVALLNGTNVFSGTNTFSNATVTVLTVDSLVGNGVGLTNLNATNLIGTIADARLSANVPLLNAVNNFSQTNRFRSAGVTNSLQFWDPSNLEWMTMTPGTAQVTFNRNITLSGGYGFSGNGAQLNTLNASSLATGTVADARLSGSAQSVVTNNVLAYGADPTGVADSTAAIQAAIDATPTGTGYSTPSGGVIIFPTGIYHTTNSIYLKHGIVLQGEQPVSIIESHGTNDVLTLDADSLAYPGISHICKIEGLAIRQIGANPNAAIHLFATTNSITHQLKNIKVFGSFGYGIRTKTVIIGTIEYCIVQNATGIGFALEQPQNAVTMTSCYATSSGGVGYDLSGVFYSTFNSLAADGNAGGGYQVRGDGLVFNGCGAEGNTRFNWFVTNSVNCSFQNGYCLGSYATTNGFRIDGGWDITLDRVSFAAGSSTNGFAILATNQSGAFPERIVVNGEIATWGAGVFYNRGDIYTTGGNDFVTKGKMGVGSYTAPLGTLEVGNITGAQPTYPGQLRVVSAGNGPETDANGIELQSSGSAAGYGYKLFTQNSDDYCGIATRWNSATWTPRFVVSAYTGRVGVGTTAPTSLFSVGGEIGTGSLRVTNNATIGGSLTVTNGLASFAAVASVAIDTTGWTNIWSTNNAVIVYGGTAVSSWKKRAGALTTTNITYPVFTGNCTVILQPGQALVTSGTSVTGSADPL